MRIRFDLVAAACILLALAPPSFADGPVERLRWGAPGDAAGQFDMPVGLAARGDDVYVADFYNHRVQRFTAQGEFLGSWGTQGSGEGQFQGPCAVALAPDGGVYVADLYNNRMQKFTADGTFVTSWGGLGHEPGRFMGPYGIAVGASGSVFVTDLDNHRVQRFDPDGALIGTWGTRGAGSGELLDPWGIAVDSQGIVYVADHGNHRIQRFSSDGSFVSGWGSHASPDQFLLGPVSLGVGPGDAVFVTDLINHQVQKFSKEGVLITQWGTEGTHMLGSLFGVAVDGDRLYVSDVASQTIFKYIDTSPGSFASSGALPGAFALGPAWPNPSAGTLNLRFALPRAGRVSATIHDLQGRMVRRVVDGSYPPGEHAVAWDGRADRGAVASAGVYFLLCRYDDGTGYESLRRRFVLAR